MITRAAVVASAALACLGSAGCDDDAPPAAAHDVEVRASGCSLRDDIASGIVVADGYVLTVAHALRGATDVSVDGAAGTVVAVDPRLDAAIVAAPTTGSAAVTADRVHVGAAHVGGRPVTVERVVVADVEEPRDDTTYRRRALVLAGEVERGDSGSGVFDLDGSLLGMVFASSRGDRGVAYAVAVSELRPFVERATVLTAPVDVGSC